MPYYTEKTDGMLLSPAAGYKPIWETFGRPSTWAPRITWHSPKYPKSNGSPKLKNNQQTIKKRWQQGASCERSLTLPQRKQVRQEQKPPSKQARWKHNSKAEQLVDYRDNLLNLRHHSNLNCNKSPSWPGSCWYKTELQKHYTITWQDYDRASA
jgi:hypothetical protein